MTAHSPEAALRIIRDFELEMARRIEVAEANADETIRRARADERRAYAAAEQRGRREADRRFAEEIKRAEEDAEKIQAEGSARVKELERNVAGRLEQVVAELVDLVLAPPMEEGK